MTERTPLVRWDAPTYDAVSDAQFGWGSAALDRLPLSGDEVVLDAGCGSGRVTDLLAARLPRGRAIGLDASTGMAEMARARLGDRAPVLVADLGRPLPLRRACVDAVFSTAAFHWVRDQVALYANLAYVIRPGGRLVAQCGGKGNIVSILEAVRAAGGEPLEPWVFLDPTEARELLASSRFVDVETWLHPEPTAFETSEALTSFLSTCVLNPWLDRLPEEEREGFARAVVDQLPALEADYARLNILATLSPD